MAYINFGDDYGKLVVVVDIADQNRVLVDGVKINGEKTFPRVLYPIKRLTLTKVVVPIQRGCRSGTLEKAAEKMGLADTWAASPPAKKLAMREKRASLSDWERFKVMRERKRRAFTVRHLVSKAISKKKPAKKAAPAKPAKGGKGGAVVQKGKKGKK